MTSGGAVVVDGASDTDVADVAEVGELDVGEADVGEPLDEGLALSGDSL
jgi:hypothetical protein